MAQTPTEPDNVDDIEEDDVVEDDVEEVVVTGTRTERPLGESPVAVEVINAETIAKSGAVDTADLLENQPGVDVVRDYLGATIRLRGLDPNQVLVLVDGQRLVGRVGGATDISRIPVEDIERIEIIKGPASALYGADAVGGVVQIFTKRAKSPAASAQLRGGTLPTLDGTASVSGGGGPLGARLTVGGHGSAAIDRDPSDVRTNLDAEREWMGSGRVDITASPDLSIPISGQYALTTTTGIDQFDTGGIFDRQNATQDARFLVQPSLTSERSRTSAHVGLSAFRDQYVSDQQDASELDTFQLTREALLQLGAQRDQVAGRHVISVGTEGTGEIIDSDRLATEDPAEGTTRTRYRGALYAQDEWHSSKKLWIVPSARLDLDSQFGAIPTPRLALRLDPVKTLTLRTSAGTAWRAPNFRELYLNFNNQGVGYTVQGNPDLVPEKALSVDGAIEWVPGDILSTSLSSWWIEQRDLIDITDPCDLTGPPAGATVYQYTNIGRAVTRGAELGATLSPVETLHATSTYTFTDARNRDTNEKLIGRASHRLTLETGYDAGSTDVTLRGSLVGPRPFVDNCEDVTVPTVILLDARVGQRIIKQIDVAVGVDNLFDSGVNPLAPLAPRLWYGAIDVHVKARKKEGRP